MTKKAMFTIDENKLDEVTRAYYAKTGDPASVTAGDLADATIGYDWHNANEHQEWLNTASAREIADWLASLVFGNDDAR